MPMHPSRENKWPYLVSEGYEVMSPETWDYNCIAFAADFKRNGGGLMQTEMRSGQLAGGKKH